jgi:Glycosyl transferase family 8
MSTTRAGWRQLSDRSSRPVIVARRSTCVDGPVTGAMRTMVEGSLPAGSAQIQWITVDLKQFSRYEGLTTHVSTMAYARILIPDLLPETRSRLLYLDADLLVLGDVAPLWTVDLQGAPLGAVLDRLDPLIKAGDPGLREYLL